MIQQHIPLNLSKLMVGKLEAFLFRLPPQRSFACDLFDVLISSLFFRLL